MLETMFSVKRNLNSNKVAAIGLRYTNKSFRFAGESR